MVQLNLISASEIDLCNAQLHMHRNLFIHHVISHIWTHILLYIFYCLNN